MLCHSGSDSCMCLCMCIHAYCRGQKKADMSLLISVLETEFWTPARAANHFNH
ncbi:mCG1045240 [Mus musculus]|nr:mCG1045240 [Mus musculus]